jgi:hypothetical protein
MRKVHGDRPVLCEIEDREAFGLTGGDPRPTQRWAAEEYRCAWHIHWRSEVNAAKFLESFRALARDFGIEVILLETLCVNLVSFNSSRKSPSHSNISARWQWVGSKFVNSANVR